MEFNSNEASVCTDSVGGQPNTGIAGEIDLYDDLIVFADLSPEEQMLLAVGQTRDSRDTHAPSEAAEEPYSSGPIATTESMAIGVETWADEVEAQPAAEAAEFALAQASTESMAAIGVETWADEMETQAAAEAAELAVLQAFVEPAPIEAVEIESRSAEETGEHTEFPSYTESAAAESATTDAAMKREDLEVSIASAERDDARAETVGPRPSGPLSGFSLPPDVVYTGTLSRGVCIACGADSGADDLFCITCGVFTEEIGSTLAVNPTCAQCKKGVAADYLFCPWCGSVLAA